MKVRASHAFAFLLVAPTPLAAQDAATPGLGPFDLDAGLEVGVGYDDNLFSTENDKRGDTFLLFAPSLSLELEREGYAFSLGAEAEIARYAEETSEDYLDALISAEGRVNLTDSTRLFGGADYAWEHEERASPEGVGGLEPTEYTRAGVFGGVAHDFGDLDARLGVNVRAFDFDDVRTSAGTVANNDDRDRVQTEFGGRVNYTLSETRRVFLQALYDQRDYDAAVDDNGFERGSQGFQAGLGLAARLGQVEGEVMAGVISQDYDDPSFDAVTTLDVGAQATWRPTPLTRLTFLLERSLEESTLYDTATDQAASGYLRTTAGLRLARRFAPDLTGSAWLFHTHNDYNEVDRTDSVQEAGARLRWHFMRHAYLSTSYAYEQRLSDAAGADYASHTVMVSLGASLDPGFEEGMPRAGLDASGFYAGLQAGDGATLTALEGARGGSGGRLAADFGDFGLSGGAFAGWRGESSGLVFGAEIDAEASGEEWSHAGDRSFSVERTGGIGLSLLFGTRTLNDALLYVRGGPVVTRFDTDYATDTASASDEQDLVGLRGGLGMELPLGGGLSARMEYTLTAWPDYDFGAEAGESDNLASMQGQARIGLLYSFGGGEAGEPTPADFDGFYLGASIGHGALAADNSGPRPNAASPNFTLDVTRAASVAAAGVHAGWGRSFDGLYLGGEVEADLATGDWNIERSPTGRIYSLGRVGGAGVSARAGWVVNESFLLYARAGVVWGRFDADYRTTGRVANDTVDLAGLRVGVGMEAPLTETLDLRLDYTRTHYESFEIDYGGGVDDFEPREGLFRVGLTRRF
ncbi:MAG: outer membrane beta-barrel protein [Pseudomonadota bacterium]